MTDLMLLLPEIALILSTVAVFVSALFIRGRVLITLMGLGSAVVVYYFLQIIGTGEAFNGMVRIDGLARSFKTVCLLAMSMALLTSVSYKKIPDRCYGEYCALLMLSTVGMMLMASAGDMLIIYLSLELMSLCIYVLVGANRQDKRSNEASLKYFLLGTLGGMLFLLSIALVYGSVGSSDIQKIGLYISQKGLSDNPLLLSALALMVSAFAFKIAAVPFHQWSPDVYEGSPTTVTAFISVGPKAAAFAAFGRLFYEGFSTMQIEWTSVFVIIAVLTMAIGNLLAMAQDNIKRMLAYSSIAHGGYMLLGIAAGSEVGIQAVAFYMLIYAFMNMGAFAVVVSVNDGEDIGSYRGLWQVSPIKAVAMLIFLTSLTGLPPTAGFVGKLNLFMAAIQAGFVAPVIFAVIFSILSAYYYLRVVAYMFFSSPAEGAIVHYPPQTAADIVIAISLSFVCLIGVAPVVLTYWAA